MLVLVLVLENHAGLGEVPSLGEALPGALAIRCVGIGIGIAVALFLLSGIRIVRLVEKGLVETFGKDIRTDEQVFHWIFPIVQRMIRVNISERMVDVEPQTVTPSYKLNAILDTSLRTRGVSIRKK